MAQVNLLRTGLNILSSRLECCISRSNPIGFWKKPLTHTPSVRTLATLTRDKKLLLNTLNKQNVVITKRMAGHNKWSNIRHIKAAKDQARSALHNRFTRLIKMAVSAGGNKTDPKLNSKLAQVLDQAKENNVSKACIESALKGATISKENLVSYTFEIKGPGKCFLIVETLTDNYKRTKQLVKACMNKTNAIYAEGISKSCFIYKGVIIIEDNGSINLDKALDDAIQAGAEDVTQIATDDGKKSFQFLSEPNEFWNVKLKLQELNYVIQSSSVRYLPVTKQPLSDSEISTAEKLYDLLEGLPEVVNIYDNIE